MKKILAMLLTLVLLIPAFAVAEEAQPVRVAAMKGPTAMGLTKLMQDAKNGTAANAYDFTVEATADAVTPLLLKGDLTSREALSLVRDCFRFIAEFTGEVPGASAKDCGNYLDMNLPMANFWGRKYAALLENVDDSRLIYPD